MANEVIFEQQNLIFTPNEEFGGLYFANLGTGNLIDGEIYQVYFDNKEYLCTAEPMTLGDASGIGIGNKSIIGIGEDTKELFLLGCTNGNMVCLSTDTTETEHSIAIYKKSGVIIKNPHGNDVTYGSYENILVKNVNGGKTLYSKLPKVTVDDNGKVLGVVDGIWSKIDAPSGGGNCSCPTGTIEKEEKIDWEFTQETIDNGIVFSSEDSIYLYKLIDATPTKEQILSGEAIGHVMGQDFVFDFQLVHEENDFIMLQDLDIAFFVFYKAGEYIIDTIPISIPTTGTFLMAPSFVVPELIGAYGCFSYTSIEEVNFVQSDWNQSDYTKPDYVRNRPFYDQEKKIPVIEKQTQIFRVDAPLYESTVTGFTYMDEYSSYGVTLNPSPFTLEASKYYEITWNGEIFNCKSFVFDGKVGVGNGTNVGQEPNELPFLLVYVDNIVMVFSNIADDCSLKVRSAHSMWLGNTNAVLTEGQQYKVLFNDEFYESKPTILEESYGTIYYFGNLRLFGSDFEDTGESFFIGVIDSNIDTEPLLAVYSTKYTENYENTFEVYRTELEFKKIEQKYISTDWNQNDENDAGYIKNRPFYVDKGKVIEHEILPSTNMTFAAGSDTDPYATESIITEEKGALWNGYWNEAIVTWDDKQYICTPKTLPDELSIKVIGNFEKAFGIGDSGEPFVGLAEISDGGCFMILVDIETPPAANTITHNVSVKIKVPEVKEIFPSTTISFSYFEDRSIYGFEDIAPPTLANFWNSDWDNVILIWDGTSYKCERKTLEGIPCIGNIDKMVGVGDTGEPFIIAVITMNGETGIIVYDLETAYTEGISTIDKTISLVQEKQEIVKLDNKFIGDIDYEKKIINKPFETIVTGTVIANEAITVTDGRGFMTTIDYNKIIEGVQYNIIINDVVYQGVGVYEDNFKILEIINENKEIIGLITDFYNGFADEIGAFPDGEYTIKISFAEDYVKKLDPIYLPDDIKLPTITPDTDEGKFLRVVGGVAAWTAIPSAEEAEF